MEVRRIGSRYRSNDASKRQHKLKSIGCVWVVKHLVSEIANNSIKGIIHLHLRGIQHANAPINSLHTLSLPRFHNDDVSVRKLFMSSAHLMGNCEY